MFRSVVVFSLLVPLQAVDVSPIEKIIQMVGELEQKIIKEGEDCQKVYAEFAEWCEDESQNLHFEIKTAKGEIEELNAAIDKAKADIETEQTKIEDLTGSIAKDEEDLKAATQVREKEAADFAAEEKELSDTVDTLERAIGILEKELKKGGASLLQTKNAKSLIQSLSLIVQASAISSADRSRLSSLLQRQQDTQNSDDEMDDLMTGAPDPAAYESKSGGIVGTLNDLLDDAEEQLAEARKKESTSKNNYEMLKQELTDAIKFGNKEMDKAKKRKAEAEEASAVAQGELETTTKDLAEDTKRLEEVHHECMTKAADFESEVAARGEELKALATAKKIIIEKTGGAAKQSYGLEQVSFLQIKSRTSTRDSAGLAALRVVRQLAKTQGSRAILALADRMATAARLGALHGDDPFAKIKGMISEMIEKLLKEAEEEATKKAYCDKEMGETKAKKEDMTEEVEDLTAKIDKMTAESKKLKEEVAVLSKELTDLAKSQAEMDKVRMEEKEIFDKNSAEMKEGIEGIQMALKVLRDYYAKDASLLQAEKASGAGAGIIGLLEVAESDFSKGLEEMTSAEETSAAEYEKATKENSVAKATKEQDVKYKSKDAKALAKSAAELTSDREVVQTELDAVLEYYAKIKEECVAKPEPYEERKKRREAEIAGLKEALQILEGEAVFLQDGSARVKAHFMA